MLDSMKHTLTSGVRGHSHHVVDAGMSPQHLPTKVLSTPSMIGLIEQTCLTTVQQHLEQGETTVGVHVCVSHSASVNSGETIDITCELTEIDRRRLVFETKVSSGGRVVSEGTHQRFVVRPGGDERSRDESVPGAADPGRAQCALSSAGGSPHQRSAPNDDVLPG